MVEGQMNGKFSQNGKFGQNGKLGHSCVRVTNQVIHHCYCRGVRTGISDVSGNPLCES